jgi:hypothetical protein
MNQFQKTVLYGMGFAIGGILVYLLVVKLTQLKPLAGTDFADQLRQATGKQV